MSTETLLWLLLVSGLMASLIATKLTARIRHLIRLNLGVGAILLVALLGILNAALWVWVAFRTGYWQIGALSVGQFLIGWSSNSLPDYERPGGAA